MVWVALAGWGVGTPQASQLNPFLQAIPQLTALCDGANHIDTKQAQGAVGLRPFIANMLNYQPAWVTALYGVRWFLVRLLGMRQSGVPNRPRLSAADVPFSTASTTSFWRIVAAQEDQFWVASVTESHLTAYLGVVAEPLADGQTRFYVLTIVHYHRWTGWVYFNLIRPFHHLVVGRMVKAGLGA